MLYCLLKMSGKGGRNDTEAFAERDKELKMPGLIRADEEIQKAVDSTGDFVYFNKNERTTNLVARADFQTIIKYAEKILETTAEKILGGCIEVKPAKLSADDDACKYCLYSALCTFDRAVNETLEPIKGKPAEIISLMAAELQSVSS